MVWFYGNSFDYSDGVQGSANRLSGATIGETLKGFLSAPERGERAANTIANYRKALNAAGLSEGTALASVDRAKAREIVTALQADRKASSANLYITNLSTLFAFAIREQMTAGPNPFDGLRIHDDTDPGERRLPFTDGDLEKIFGTAEWRQATGLRRFSLLIQLFTGARSGEVNGLEPDDIGEFNGIPVIRFRDNGRRKLKNKVSQRTVPIPQQLVDMGVMDLDLSFHDKGVSRWTNRLIRSVIGDQKKTQHSARHTFADRARNEWGLDIAATNAIGGWTGGALSAEISQRVYGGKPSIRQLQELTSKVQFKVIS
tara:strand:- start:6184 stop:7128 length:945 start_codon:yes stop_codon:yes gene_type:complete